MTEPRFPLVTKYAAWFVTALMVAGALSVVVSATVLPVSCERCHSAGDFGTATEAASHAEVECAQCHVGRGFISRVAYGFTDVLHVPTLRSGVGRDGSHIPDARCLTCHQQTLEGTVTSNGISVQHETCSVGQTCTDCHSTAAHGTQVRWVRTYTMDGCLECHSQGEALANCDSCHTGRRVEDRVTTGPWAVTHGPDWRSTHGMGSGNTCSACHPQDFCGKCHGAGLPHNQSFKNDHGTFARQDDARCDSCHRPQFCSDCHGLEMPHPNSFKVDHSAIVDRDGDSSCKVCHGGDDCTRCHELHVHPGGAISSTGEKPLTGREEG